MENPPITLTGEQFQNLINTLRNTVREQTIEEVAPHFQHLQQTNAALEEQNAIQNQTIQDLTARFEQALTVFQTTATESQTTATNLIQELQHMRQQNANLDQQLKVKDEQNTVLQNQVKERTMQEARQALQKTGTRVLYREFNGRYIKPALGCAVGGAVGGGVGLGFPAAKVAAAKKAVAEAELALGNASTEFEIAAATEKLELARAALVAANGLKAAVITVAPYVAAAAGGAFALWMVYRLHNVVWHQRQLDSKVGENLWVIVGDVNTKNNQLSNAQIQALSNLNDLFITLLTRGKIWQGEVTAEVRATAAAACSTAIAVLPDLKCLAVNLQESRDMGDLLTATHQYLNEGSSNTEGLTLQAENIFNSIKNSIDGVQSAFVGLDFIGNHPHVTRIPSGLCLVESMRMHRRRCNSFAAYCSSLPLIQINDYLQNDTTRHKHLVGEFAKTFIETQVAYLWQTVAIEFRDGGLK